MNDNREKLSGPGWTVPEVLEATGGKLVSGSRSAVFRSVSTDSRTVGENDLFVALLGENFDGEKFCIDAVNRGAAGIMVGSPPKSSMSVPVVVVGDTLRALGDLSAYRRRQMKNLRVIAITGSSGKTTVKEMVASILGQKYKLIKTTGNFNNLIGLPLSLLPVEESHRIAILEMGMNRPGEIKRLTEIADPDIGCINNIQAAHLQGLANIEGVAQAKGELFAGMKPSGFLVVNLEDPNVVRLAARYENRKITYGFKRRAMVRGTYLKNLGEKGFSFTLNIEEDRRRVKLSCPGRYNVLNALAAAAMAYAVGIGLDAISRGLSLFVSYDKRMELENSPLGLKVVNDTYNANPASMLAALETVAAMKDGHRTVAVLGDMLELGPDSALAHRSIGESAARLQYDYLLAYGSFAAEMVKGARGEGMTGGRAKAFDEKERIVLRLKELVGKGDIGGGDWLLVKGSRGVAMETVIDGLKKEI